MSVTIGGLVFNGAMGTPYPAVPVANLEAWATAAEAYRFKGSPRKDGGFITAWLDCTEVNAQRRLADAGGLIGYTIAVVYPHGTISNLTVATADGEWQAKKGTVNGGVLVLRMTFDYELNKGSGDVEKSLVWCETSSSLAGPWTQQPDWACLGQQDGLGTYAGDAEATVVNKLPDLSLIGKYVRLVRKEGYPATKTVEWVGAIMNANAHGRRDPSTGTKWGSKTTYSFAGIAAVLARLIPSDWVGTQQGGEDFGGPAGGSTTQVRCGFLDFNAGGGRDRGNSLVQVDAATVVDGVAMPTVYLHGTGVGSLGDKWNAGQALRTFLAIARDCWSSIPIVIPTAYNALLTYEETWSVGGQSVLDFIAQVLSPSVKRTFRLETVTGEAGVAGSGFVRVVPIDLEEVGTEIDASTNSSTDWEAGIDGTQTSDKWFLSMGPREVIATVDFYDNNAEDGTKGWTGADQTTWDGRSGIGKVDSKILAVWRRYVMRRQWLMATVGGTIQNVREIVGGDETGELVGTEPPPDGVYGWRISRTLPFGPGADFSNSSARNITPKSPVTGPLVFFFKAGTYTLAHETFQVQVEDQMAGISLGRGSDDQDALKTKVETDDHLIRATLSFVHYLDWRASRTTTAATPRSDAPRVTISSLRPEMRRIDIVDGTVVGLTSDTAAVTAAAGRKDNGPDIAVFADSFKRWFLTDSGSLQWTNPSVDTITPAPGLIVSQVKVVESSGPPPTTGIITLGGIPIAQRRVSWDLYNPGVTWTASRIMPAMTFGGKGAVVAQNGNAPRQASPGAKDGTTQPKPARGR